MVRQSGRCRCAEISPTCWYHVKSIGQRQSQAVGSLPVCRVLFVASGVEEGDVIWTWSPNSHIVCLSTAS